MKKKIKVEVGYYDFIFDDVEKAVNFAETAVKTNKDNRSVSVHIDFCDDEDEE